MFCRHIVSCLLNCITETVQVTEGRKCFPRGRHVGQPCSRKNFIALKGNKITTFALSSIFNVTVNVGLPSRSLFNDC